MQAIRDAVLLLVVILVIASVRISPAPGLALTPTAEAGMAEETSDSAAQPRALHVVPRGDVLVVPALGETDSPSPAPPSQLTVCAPRRHVLQRGDDRVVVLEMQWSADGECCEPGAAAECA